MDWFDANAWWAWLGLAMTLGAAEMLSLELTLAMLSVGALAGMLAALIGLPLLAQVFIALATAAAMLALVRPPILRRLHAGPDLRHGPDRLLGQRAVVTELISADQSGRIKLDGEIWSAAPYDESLVIEPGQAVEVFEIRGATAYVHPVAALPPT